MRFHSLPQKSTVWSLVRSILLIALCFGATLLLLRVELEQRNERAILSSLPTFAQQSSRSVTRLTQDVSTLLYTAAQTIAQSGDMPSEGQSDALLTALEAQPSLAQAGIRFSDGTALLSDGRMVDDLTWTDTRTLQGDQGPYSMGEAIQADLDGTETWAIRFFVSIPGQEAQVFGTVPIEAMFAHSFFTSLEDGNQNLMIFETETGSILLDTLQPGETVGSSVYDVGLFTQEESAMLQSGQSLDQVIHVETDDGTLYLYAQPSSVDGWSLCAEIRSDDVGSLVGSTVSSGVVYGLLVLLYLVATVAVVISQLARERTVQEKLDQEVARNNTLVNATLPSADVQVFELLPNGMIRRLAPELGQGQELKSTISTPDRLLSDLNCSPQWSAALQAALRQAIQGMDSEVEMKTMSPDETWLQLHIEHLEGNEETAAIGIIRDITPEVKARHHQEDTAKLLGRMMESTMLGVEISLEENSWRMLWGREQYALINQQADQWPTYSDFLQQRVLPTLDPRDRDTCMALLDRSNMLSAFFSGQTHQTHDYRVRLSPRDDYEWHSAEIDFFRDASTRQAKCNLFVRQVTAEKLRELEERQRLEEKELSLFLQAKKLGQSEDELDFVQVISDYYHGIYVVNLNDDNTRSIKVPDFFADYLRQVNNSLSATLARYNQDMVAPEHQEAFRRIVDFDFIRWKLLAKSQIELTYQRRDGTWLCMRVLPAPDFSSEQPDTVWIFENETETVNLRQEEEKARVTAQAAEAASRAKSQFLANMSHDIRTPLNAILGMSELGLREENSEEKDNCFRDIRGSGRILLENINSILDLSKIEAGKMEIVPENYHILTALHDTITVLRMRAKDKGLAFHANVDENIPTTLFGDDMNINHIIMNLGSNAVKYTPSGSVTMNVAWEPLEEDGNLVIHMEDTGTGIREEDIPQIFRSYGRLDDQGVRKVEGTGLGLPICQSLTQLMNGQIGVDSTYGVGSDFWVYIPQKVVDPAPCGPYREDTRRETEVSTNTFTAPEAVVLVVDDQPLNLKVCQGLLRPYEMQVYTARSGQEALRQMTQVWPDLVLMDHMMPDMDGLEVTKRIREQGVKDPYFSVLPIIALTANAMKGVKEYYLENGFNDFISKPIELDHLDDVLRTWIPEDKQRDAVNPVGPLIPEPVPEELKDLPGIDSTQGMAYCGTVQVYRSTLILFRDQIDAKAKRMEEFRQAGNLPDYIVEVHSLKSAARWIGAAKLGDLAEALEMAARAGDQSTVDQDTPGLLEQYRALKAPLLFLKEV